MFNDPEDYDAIAVEILAGIDAHLKGLEDAPWQPLRRSNMIRAALVGQVEYKTPPPEMVVFEQLKRALIAQTKKIGADVDWIRKELKLLEKHIRARPK